MVRLFSPGQIDREVVDELRRRIARRAAMANELIEKVVFPKMEKGRLSHEVDVLRFLTLDIAECDASDMSFVLRHGRVPNHREGLENDWRTDDEAQAEAAS